MENLNNLYSLLEQNNISVLSYDFARLKSVSVVDEDGDMHIGIDPMQLTSHADELCTLAHEAGHCETGSFYNRYSRFDLREKHERRADVWSFCYLCPKQEIERQLQNGNREVWQLAECFSVTECFMRKALYFYQYL